MAWITLTTIDNPYIPEHISKRVVNTDLVTHITDAGDGRAVVFLAVGTDKSQRYFTVQESQASIMAQLAALGEKVSDTEAS